MTTIRLTAAQAMVRWLSVQMTEEGETFLAGVWAIFGHGNVAGIGEALHAHRNALPTWRGQNEQTMAHTAIAYAKQMRRRRAMAVTSSIGPGATNMVTAAALAHVNRIPLLLIPGDVFASRRPDPVLQQLEDASDATATINDCLRPVSAYFDRIMRPEQLLLALPRALRVMTDPAECGPVTLAFCQDVQAEAYDWPESFFTPKVWRIRRPEPDPVELAQALEILKAAERPVIVAGGGVLYSGAEAALLDFAKRRNIPFAETQAGKGGVDWREETNLGAPGVTGSDPANRALAEADVVLGIGTRFADFTTGSWTVFANPDRRLISVNLSGQDAAKHGALPLLADARAAIAKLEEGLDDRVFTARDHGREAWLSATDAVMAAPNGPGLPSDAQVVGAVQRQATDETLVMCAAGSMPGALHTLWRSSHAGYHMEYGYSTMGYEIAGAIGIRMAAPEREVICFVGDGSYMMANSELATAVMRRVSFTVILTDNRGYGCINRLQAATGGAAFNNLYVNADVEAQPEIDFVAHAGSMGAHAVKAETIAALEAEIRAARTRDIPTVIVIDTDPDPGTGVGGHWWDVAVPEVSERAEVRAARAEYEKNATRQRAD
ncbi:3D-(3,5/4)-trihydroxycyclohexane-1,2-dione acylhydrolase (decyclizing) [Wenxinia marina]|uniref:3D-(3,5/4)-trihydroxycyclohexane-1,2-dione hydrolase n=1 Tax=Wenxinia marina DSM 24838 TaxID=1123501 RepID=A0A0D0PG17_9RHOB|nr:3D-(3,5/4)-trihydroxycyclohexane-1,2-dione acylhydrolase (decyclizing) [Wenxinia marina]KIQ70266.1 3D-(3,5/4)-trihydroxycyclohexane-1,2-dione hydrolase [Wenxinia marina DSM 24838]GGL49931.1 3D-(3,5/4)-trihydroxycyclohexane-1,2-dione acylhydrolase (decyclizing) [Wenxinia marina]